MTPSLAFCHESVPPILALPVELKLDIVSKIPHDEYPSLACLRRTHSSFLDLIPKAHIRYQLSETDLCHQLLKTELAYAYLLPPDHYPCYLCARVLPLDVFTIVHPFPFFDALDDKRMKNKPWSRCRSCKDCCMRNRMSHDYITSLIWIEQRLEEMPTPPLPPRLLLPRELTVDVVPEILEHDVRGPRQQARDHDIFAAEDHGSIGVEEA